MFASEPLHSSVHNSRGCLATSVSERSAKNSSSSPALTLGVGSDRPQRPRAAVHHRLLSGTVTQSANMRAT